ncbi:DUF2062 domain-containing protein [Paenibacillus sp. JX-17]|uniref:DUF2062 domain-containing protein n=1 Tax=Paenibacillus lacisoli TaxID=3064525 RepID=A0ABT9CAI7_9BACL|nr:DUF2062 domain-containing protein [Paenibacillus sp. JX-17]MDO7905664.1 DUF2062 domain-containing protein [Paenibacillus sp. JX-17]
MKKKNNKHNFAARIIRALRLNFIKLLRAPGGVKKISLGFSIGFGLEMVVISTASLIYLLFYPIVRLSGGSLPAAIIGNVIGKLTFLPIVLMPLAKKLGEQLYPSHGGPRFREHSWTELFSGNWSVLYDILHGGLHILIGMSVFGLIFGVISYFVIQVLYNRAHHRRMEKRRVSRSRRAAKAAVAAVKH